jgi:signal transduction histidine kinase
VKSWALPAVLTLLSLVSAPYIQSLSPVDQPMDAVGLSLIALSGVSLVARNRWPAATLAVVALSVSSYLLLGYPYGPVMLCLAVAVYSVARRLPLVPASIWSAGALLVLLSHLFTNKAALGGALGLIPGSAWIVIPFTVGLARRLVVEARERERRETERRLVDAERLRLAQEVHDVVGHGLAAIQMQADIALHLRQSKPDQAHVALEAISRATADALTELRATLETITADKRPTPGLARVDELRRRVEDAGVSVDLAIRGPVRKLPSAVDVAAYRVLQESLTNVVKHSSHPRVTVLIEYTEKELNLTVTNQDRLGGPHVDGFGITGMRRRVTHLGGRLTAGAGEKDGTFAVRATVPVDA